MDGEDYKDCENCCCVGVYGEVFYCFLCMNFEEREKREIEERFD